MSRPNHHGYAALAREDVADAKAGTSGVDLRGYAAERGLEVIAGSLPAGGTTTRSTTSPTTGSSTAAEGVSTPLGGVREEAPVVAEVRDGVLACWSRRTADRTVSEVDQLVAASLRAARRYGLAAV